MHVSALNLHPVKACGRIEVDRARVGPYGLVGDREWQIVGRSGMLTQRSHPALARVRPQLAEGGIVLRAEGMPDLDVSTPAAADVDSPTFTGDVRLGDAGDAAAEWLSAFLGDAARLVGIAPGYERRFLDVFATEVALGDACPVLVVNEASHRFLHDRAKEPFGLDRWRANIVVEGAEPWAEDTWRTVRIGSVTITCVIPWPRCAVPQVDQETGERHTEPAVVLKANRWCPALPEASPLVQAMLCGNALFGMASSALPAGAEISVGAEVEVVETGPALL